MDAKNIAVSAGVALLVVVLGLAYFGPTKTVERFERVIEKLGAIPGSEIPGPVAKINGAPIIGLSQRFTTGTTTVCSLDLRPYASSSILAIGATVQGVPTTTTGSVWRFYTSSNGFASSTFLLGRGAITATGSSLLATSTPLDADTIIDSGDNYITLDVEGANVPYLAIEGNTGVCSVLLHSPNAQ